MSARMEDLRQSVRGPLAACGSIGVMRQQEDWYAYLNIATDAPTEQIEQAVERLSRQATALAVTAPERSQRLRDTVRTIKRDLLSGPEARARYDAGRNAPAEPPPAPAPEAASVPPPPTAAPSPWHYPPPPTAPTAPTAPTSPAADGGPGGWPGAGAPAGGAPGGWPGSGPGGGGPAAGGPGGWAGAGAPAGGGPAGGPGGAPGGAPGGGGPGGGPGGGAPAGPGWPGGGAGGGEKISARLARFLRTGWTCAECGKEALPSDKFCTRCGTTITPTRHEAAPPTTRVTCVNCAAPMGVNDAFCARCGSRGSK
jgi:hypothetical protein